MAEFGIHPYHRTDRARADLVLVHGLMGHSTGTWTGEDDKGQPTYWPDWIKERHPDVNIWRADYDSSLDAWLQPAMSLDQIAASLLVNAHDQGLGTRPIHWVGHSMGGLVIKHLLCRAQTRVKPGLHNIARVPTAITFLGTPHHGSDVADWKGYFGSLLTALDLFVSGGTVTGAARLLAKGADKARNQQIESHVEQLSVHSRELGKLNDDFAQWLGAADRACRLIEARNYYETRPVKNLVVVVPERCARLSNAAIEDIPTQEHHLSICKYASQRNTVFIGVAASLKSLCGHVDALRGQEIDGGPPAPNLPQEQVEAGWHMEHRPFVADSHVVGSNGRQPEVGDSPPNPQLVDEIDSPRSDADSIEQSSESTLDASFASTEGIHRRQVFISYAANDPDWTDDRVRRFAAQLDALPVIVRLDTRFEESMQRNVAPAEWRRWMDESLEVAANIVCLCSERYALAWTRNESLSGGCGVAFESSRIEAYLYDRKQNNSGRVLVVKTSAHLDKIPPALRDACPRYVWGNEKNDRRLWSHLSGFGAPRVSTEMRGGTSRDAVDTSMLEQQVPADGSFGKRVSHGEPGIPLDRDMLRHQADHAIKSLQLAGAYWAALQISDHLMTCLDTEKLVSPRAFVDALTGLSPGSFAGVMRELRRAFTEHRRAFSDADAEYAAASLVACCLYCTCLMIKADATDQAVRLPSIADRDAAGLLASLIALVMVGGRLDLRQGDGVLPVGTGTYRLQRAGRHAEHDFERQLFTLLMKDPWSASAGLKTGPLTKEERAELLEELRELRGDGIYTTAMCFIIDCEEHPGNDALGVARVIGVPVFHAHADIAHRLVGVDEATLVTRLKHLWRDVSSHRRFDREDDTP